MAGSGGLTGCNTQHQALFGAGLFVSCGQGTGWLNISECMQYRVACSYHNYKQLAGIDRRWEGTMRFQDTVSLAGVLRSIWHSYNNLYLYIVKGARHMVINFRVQYKCNLNDKVKLN